MMTFVKLVVLTVVYFLYTSCLSVPKLSLNSQPRLITQIGSIRETCCDHGRTHGNAGGRCKREDFDINALVDPKKVLQELCYIAFDDCCSQSKLNMSCSKGIALAKSGANCWDFLWPPPHSDSLRVLLQTSRCCDSCRQGLNLMIFNYGTCPGPLPSVTNLKNLAFLDCCQRLLPVSPSLPVTTVSLEPQQLQGQTDVIDPEPSFVQTVPQIPILETHPKPHKKTCVDIDECQENSHNCPPEKECFNLDGNFECRTKIMSNHSTVDGNETQNLCSEGQVWDETSKLCICEYDLCIPVSHSNQLFHLFSDTNE